VESLNAFCMKDAEAHSLPPHVLPFICALSVYSTSSTCTLLFINAIHQIAKLHRQPYSKAFKITYRHSIMEQKRSL